MSSSSVETEPNNKDEPDNIVNNTQTQDNPASEQIQNIVTESLQNSEQTQNKLDTEKQNTLTESLQNSDQTQDEIICLTKKDLKDTINKNLKKEYNIKIIGIIIIAILLIVSIVFASLYFTKNNNEENNNKSFNSPLVSPLSNPNKSLSLIKSDNILKQQYNYNDEQQIFKENTMYDIDKDTDIINLYGEVEKQDLLSQINENTDIKTSSLNLVGNILPKETFENDYLTSENEYKTKDNIIYVLLTGGFGDNLKTYSVKYYYPKHKFIFINVPNTKELASKMLSPKSYINLIEHKNLLEVGQKTTNMSLFKFPDVIDYVPDTDKKFLMMFNFGKALGTFGSTKFLRKHKKDLSKYLLNPVVNYSDYCLQVCKKIKNEDYAMLGIRWCYPCINECGNIFLSKRNIKFVTQQIPEFLNRYNNIILVFDNWKMLELFRVMYYDILYNDGNVKNLIILTPIGPNDIHDMIKIASYIDYDKFLHNYSGFYQILSIVMK